MIYSKISGLTACKIAVLSTFLFTACSEEPSNTPLALDGGYTEEQALLENINVVAYARAFEIIEDSTTTKFVSSVRPGSIIRLSELDSVTFETTGLFYYSRTEDSTGVFEFNNISPKSPYVMLDLAPYECTAALHLTDQDRKWIDDCYIESAHHVLNSLIVDLRKSKNVGINAVTTIESKRVLSLISQGMSFEDAKQQADSEILSAFGIHGVPYRFDKAVSDENQDEVLFTNYMVGYAASLLSLATLFANAGSFKEIPHLKKKFIQGIIRWFDNEWVSDSIKAHLHDYAHNFMASLWGLDPCVAENEGDSTAIPYDEHRNIDFVCKDGVWSYLIHYTVPDSVGAVLGQMTDPRDGSKYKTVTYYTEGKAQTWLAENLKYNSADGIYFWNEVMDLPDSVALIPYESCIEENSYTKCDSLQAEKSNLDYEKIWAITDSVKATDKAYQGICPDGWHLPDANEWNTLLDYVIQKIDIRSLANEDVMAIAGFGESDVQYGTKYAVKIDRTFDSTNDLIGREKSTTISILVAGSIWEYVSREKKYYTHRFFDYYGKNVVSVRCIKD